MSRPSVRKPLLLQLRRLQPCRLLSLHRLLQQLLRAQVRPMHG